MQAVESGVSNSATKEELNAVEEALTEHIESIDLTVYETKTDAENKLTAANKYTDDTVASEREYIDTALAGKSGTDHKHDNLYDHIGASETALTTAKEYTDKAVSGKSDNTHTHDEKYDELGAAEGALKTAKEYTDTLIAGKSDATHNHNDVYYTEAEIDAMVFITVDDIDEIVGSSIVSAVGREY